MSRQSIVLTHNPSVPLHVISPEFVPNPLEVPSDSVTVSGDMPMTWINGICDEWHNVDGIVGTPFLAATADQTERAAFLREWAAAFLIALLLLGLLFVVFLVIAIQRRQRRSAERKRREAPLQNAWEVAGQRAQPFGGDEPVAAPPAAHADEDEEYDDDDDDDAVTH